MIPGSATFSLEIRDLSMTKIDDLFAEVNSRFTDIASATATEVHRGGRTGIYDIEVTNQAGETVAVFRGRSYATRQPLIESDTK